jgi:tetraacyldisaccharide 4'-kinase
VNWESWHKAIVSGTDRSLTAVAVRAGLRVAELGYRAAIASRNICYEKGLWSRLHLPRPVVSVGNLTVGGTGKTPMVIELTRRLIAAGHHPAVLLRGYRASTLGSDEARELACELGATVPVGVGSDRVQAAARVLSGRPDVDVFVLDDGFQHRRVLRELDLVLIDATEPFGYGHVLPRGLLREPAANLRRADAVIVTRADQATDPAGLDARIERLCGCRPVAHAAYRWEGFRDAEGGVHDDGVLADRVVVGVCGVGNPGAFERMLRQSARAVPACVAMPDHRDYNLVELKGLLGRARQLGAQAVVTTEKDWVKWETLTRGEALGLPVYRPVLRVRFLDGEAAVDSLLRGVVQKAGVSRV